MRRYVFTTCTFTGSEADGTQAAQSWRDELKDRLQQMSDADVKPLKQPPSEAVASDPGRPSSKESTVPLMHHPNQPQSTEHSDVCTKWF